MLKEVKSDFKPAPEAHSYTRPKERISNRLVVNTEISMQKTRRKHYTVYLLLLDDPALFPGPLLDTTEIAFAIASTAESLSANVFLSERSASEKLRKASEIKFYLGIL